MPNEIMESLAIEGLRQQLQDGAEVRSMTASLVGGDEFLQADGNYLGVS